ncbi:MAG: hypothetical protein IJS47_01960 [Clostridia bacterium]|nr:hypothetical protein [Clostridia bacterium]
MKKILAVLSFILLFVGCSKEVNIKKYEGTWGDELDNIQIFCVDDNTIDFNYFLYRTLSFYVKDVTIDENGYGEFNPQEEYEPKGKIYLQNNKVKLVIESHTFDFESELPYEITFNEHKKYKVIEKGAIEESINKTIEEGLAQVDTEIFNVEKDSKNYLTLKVLDLVRYIDEVAGEKYYAYDDNYYNIDKTQKKVISFHEFLGNDNEKVQKVFNYLHEQIKIKSNEYNEEYGVDDPEPHWVIRENYFIVDENAKVLKVMCSYPFEAARVYGTIWIDVPFSEFE